MAGSANLSAEAAISAPEIRQALARIVQSKYFAHAPKKQKFVQVITEYYLQGRAAELNEYLIGCEAFDKGTEFHPAADPVVRVAAHDVRKKLEAYYTHEGANDTVRLVIPVGSYMPVFSRVAVSANKAEFAPPSSGEADSAAPSSLASSSPSPAVSPLAKLVPLSRGLLRAWIERRLEQWAKPLLLGAGVVILCLVAASVWLLMQNRALQQRPVRALAAGAVPTEPLGIWTPFLTNQFSTLLILSNPVVYRTAHGADPAVIVKKAVRLSAEQTALLASLSDNRLPIRPEQPMQLIPAFNMYTGIGEAIGAYRLHGLLTERGEVSLLKQSRNVGADDLKDHDVVLLGSIYSNQWAKPLSLKENFAFTSHASIENAAPRTGEEREYVSAFDQRTGALVEDYALISVVPGVAGTNAVMSLAGIYSEGTQAAAEFVTDKARLAELQQRLQELAGAQTPPPYFQALLKVRVENAFPTQTTLLHVRELQR